LTKFRNPSVAAIFDAYPKNIRAKLLSLRELIFSIAAETKSIGELEETLKWGQPSYVTAKSKSGSTIRIDQIKSASAHYAIYFHCQTTLVETFRQLYPTQFTYGGNRSILFGENDDVAIDELSHCISLALTYHLNQKRKTSPRPTTGTARRRKL